MIKYRPTSSGLWHVEGVDCNKVLRTSRNLERQGRWADACEERAAVAQSLLDAMEDEVILLDWQDEGSRAALQLLYFSAADYLSVGEVETATALWESVVDFDEEDHLQATIMLAFCYVELGDFECLDSIISDISPKLPESALLTLWSAYRRQGGIDRDALRLLRTRHKAWYEEFVAEQHLADEEFLKDCRAERPSPRTEAREFWFATEPIWQQNLDFVEAIIKA